MRMSYGVRKQQGRGDGIKLSTKEEHERMEVCQRRGRMTDKKWRWWQWATNMKKINKSTHLEPLYFEKSGNEILKGRVSVNNGSEVCRI